MLFFLRKCEAEELEAGGPYDFKPFRSKQQPDGSWKDEPYDLSEKERGEVYRVLSVDKNRYGADAGDNGVAFLYKYRGDFVNGEKLVKYALFINELDRIQTRDKNIILFGELINENFIL